MHTACRSRARQAVVFDMRCMDAQAGGQYGPVVDTISRAAEFREFDGAYAAAQVEEAVRLAADIVELARLTVRNSAAHKEQEAIVAAVRGSLPFT